MPHWKLCLEFPLLPKASTPIPSLSSSPAEESCFSETSGEVLRTWEVYEDDDDVYFLFFLDCQESSFTTAKSFAESKARC